MSSWGCPGTSTVCGSNVHRPSEASSLHTTGVQNRSRWIRWRASSRSRRDPIVTRLRPKYSTGYALQVVSSEVTTPEKLAALLVERHGLKPPVNIEQVLREYSDVEQYEWTQDCDGFAIFGENQSRPRVYIKANVSVRRKRFTFAHELGHIVCYWHTGQKCVSIPNQDGAALGTEEAEANSFASHILLPDSFLAQFQEQYLPAPEILDVVAQADVSASAGVLALRRVLLPGYVFLVPGLDHAVVSTGTFVPPGTEDYSQLAKYSGRHPHQGSLIRWYQFCATESLPVTPQASVTATEMLRIALTAARPEKDVSALMKKINGVVGGTLTRTRAAVSAGTIFAALEQRFRNDPMYEDLMVIDEFRRYLRQKAVDVAQRRMLCS